VTTTKEVHEELRFISDRISTQVRSLALAAIALVWAFLVGGSEAPALAGALGRGALLATAVLAIAALAADYLQYFFGYVDSERVRRQAEAAGAREVEYSYTALTYRLRTLFFWLKQVLALGAVGTLGFQIARALLR
jgi:hypothetical protein